MTAQPAIVLATLNAKYIHASLGLRYVLANMGELRKHTTLREFTIARPVGGLRYRAGQSLKPAGAFAVKPRWPLQF